MEHCDDKNSGALWWQEPWSIVITRSWNIVMTRILEHCAEKDHGALWWHSQGTLRWKISYMFWYNVISNNPSYYFKMCISEITNKKKGKKKFCFLLLYVTWSFLFPIIWLQIFSALFSINLRNLTITSSCDILLINFA